MTRRVLVYRLGSLGDTVMALPALHLVRRRFPDAEIRVLTDFASNSKAPAMAAVLGDSGLVDGYFEYPLATRSPAQILRLSGTVRRWQPDVAVYMAAPRGRKKAWRDVAFLKVCGAKRVVGAPLSQNRQVYRYDPATRLWESEASRLGRCLTTLGDAEIGNRANWDLMLSDGERMAGRRALGGLYGQRFLAISPGGKSEVQDWGEANWRSTLGRLTERAPAMGLVAVGAGEEFDRCARLLGTWRGPSVNLCGAVPPRVAAAAMAAGVGFLGHDSGPLHLAAATGLACTGIFSSHNLKGVWFPHGANHHFFYTDISCAGCELLTCAARSKECISSIEPMAVVDYVAQSIIGRNITSHTAMEGATQ